MNEKFIRLNGVKSRTGLSRSTIYSLVLQKKFPTSIQIGERSVAWLESEINQWIECKIKESKRGIINE